MALAVSLSDHSFGEEFSGVGSEESLLEERQYRGKSTLETFPLPSMDTEDLAGAVIGGALDAPAVGEEIEAPQELRVRNNQADSDLLKEEFAIAPTPQSVPETPRLPPVIPKQHIYDYLILTPR